MPSMICTCGGTTAMPPRCRIIHWPEISSTSTMPQTQGKKRPNTPRHSASLCGGSRTARAAGRKHWCAKNIPPTQMMLART